jgi:hypothetical protein
MLKNQDFIPDSRRGTATFAITTITLSPEVCQNSKLKVWSFVPIFIFVFIHGFKITFAKIKLLCGKLDYMISRYEILTENLADFTTTRHSM